MANSPELKIDDKCSEKLQRIESEISKAKKDLENFKNTNNPELQAQIEALEKKLQKLEEEKQTIIAETQKCLTIEKVWKTEIAQVNANLDNTNLSWEEKKEIKKALEKEWNTFDGSNIETWSVLWIILAILKTLFSRFTTIWENEYAEVDNNWKEIPGTRRKSKEVSAKDKEIFINSHKEIAKQIEREYQIPWQVVITQAWLESAWWTSLLASKYNNYFWIKAFWKKPSVFLMTKEDRNWSLVDSREEFKVYKDTLDSFRAYGEFLKTNPRYQNAFNYSNDPARFAVEIARAWYATDRAYASKLTSTMKWIA